jgi:hypothetical protein
MQGRCPASAAKEGACPEMPDHLTGLGGGGGGHHGQSEGHDVSLVDLSVMQA